MTNKLKDYRKLVYSLRFSLEIEAEFPIKIDIDLLKERYKKLLSSWTVVSDHSMENGLEFKPKDKNKLYFKKESFDEIREILNIIRFHKGNPDGKRAGLHIHIDAKKISDLEIIKIVKEMIARQEFIVRDFKVRKERLEKYCKFIKLSDIKGLTEEDINSFRNDQYDSSTIKILNNKYFLLNLMSLKEYGSIEFRMANGTGYLREIKKNIKCIYEFIIIALERE